MRPQPGEYDATQWTVDVGPAIGAELDRRAATAGISASDLARRVLLEWLAQNRPSSALATGILRLDPRKRTATVGGRSVRLSPLETRVLAALLQQPGEPVSVEELSVVAWGVGTEGSRRALSVHLSRLREKLGPAVRIRAIRLQGYWIELGPEHRARLS